MKGNGVRWDGMADFQRSTMPERERALLDKAVADLAKLPPDRWPPRKAVRLEGEPPLYVLVLPRGIRALVAPIEDNGIQVQSLMNEADWRWLRGKDKG